jgi:hypothetical protein
MVKLFRAGEHWRADKTVLRESRWINRSIESFG